MPELSLQRVGNEWPYANEVVFFIIKHLKKMNEDFCEMIHITLKLLELYTQGSHHRIPGLLILPLTKSGGKTIEHCGV